MEYILREAVKEAYRKFTADGDEVERAWFVIDSIPAADVRPVVHGKWIPDDETGLPICSNCFSGKPKSCVCTSVIDHHLHNKEIRYCYFCGADMREEQT